MMFKVTRILPLVLVLTLVGISGAEAQGTLTGEDHAEIQRLYARYNLAIDSGDAEGWAGVFTEDGVFGNSEGRAALIEFAKSFYEGQGGNARHWNTNVDVTATRDGAEGTCYLQLWNVGVRPATITVTGVYHDTLVKTAGGWRFKTRRVEMDRPAASGQ